MDRWFREWLQEVDIYDLAVDEAPVYDPEDRPLYLDLPAPRSPLHGHGNRKYAPNDEEKKDHRLPSYDRKTVPVKRYNREGEVVVAHKRRPKLKP